MSWTRERRIAGAGSSEPSPRAAVARFHGLRAIVSSASGRRGAPSSLRTKTEGRRRLREERQERRRVRRRTGGDDEKDVRHGGVQQRAGLLERARHEDLGARFLERTPDGLRHLAAGAKKEKGPHVRDFLEETVRASPAGVKRIAILSR